MNISFNYFSLLKFLFLLIFILVGVAFYTLLERKVLGYVHFRFGPNKVGYMGILQPFSDAIKLFSKEMFKIVNLSYFIYLISPLWGMLLSLLLWLVYSYWGGIIILKYSMIFLFCSMSMMLYFLLYSGWSSGSKYSIFGSYRSSAQSLSYEIIMVSLIFIFFLINMSYEFLTMYIKFFSFYFILFPLFFVWIMCCLAECNRSPFDFSEGESELVSGFNTEYDGGLFSLIFITEYSSIIFLSFMTVFIFGGYYTLFYQLVFLMLYYYLWVRSSFPRMRYDKLMDFSWKGIMFFTMSFIIVFFIFFFI